MCKVSRALLSLGAIVLLITSYIASPHASDELALESVVSLDGDTYAAIYSAVESIKLSNPNFDVTAFNVHLYRVNGDLRAEFTFKDKYDGSGVRGDSGASPGFLVKYDSDDHQILWVGGIQ